MKLMIMILLNNITTIIPASLLAALIGLLSLAPLMADWSHILILEWEVAKMAGLSLAGCIILDVYSLSFLFSVSLISTSVLIFSSSYMSKEPFYSRFHLLVSLFILSMVILIVSPNLVSLLLGWDGLGLTSYLLVAYFQGVKSYNASLLTALSNRVGDVALLLSIACMAPVGAWGFSLLAKSQGSNWLPTLLMVLAACTKSAQIPFSAWLPAAMAAPTPVSSLVHSSTLVTAGVYLTFRFSPAITQAGAASALCALGCATMIMAGMAALGEMDMKKIVALSTLSQLGVMMATLGAGLPAVGFFHLLSHAYFKALLFMTVGAMIHMSNDYQDLRKISLLPTSCPTSFSFSVLANLSLCGMPFASGFYSKDACIELFLTTPMGPALGLVFMVATALTVAYTVRFIVLLGLSASWCPASAWENDRDLKMLTAMGTLGPWALMGGSLLAWMLFPSPLHTPLTLIEKNSTLTVIVLGGLLGLYLCLRSPRARMQRAPSFFLLMWALPAISARLLSFQGALLSGLLRGSVDQSWTPNALTGGASLGYPSSLAGASYGFKLPMLTGGGIFLAVLSGLVLYLHVMSALIVSGVKFRVFHVKEPVGLGGPPVPPMPPWGALAYSLPLKQPLPPPTPASLETPGHTPK